MAHTIEIDFDVFKALTLRRSSEETSYNDVLRDAFKLPPVRRAVQEPVGAPSGGDWVTKGVRFPAGTEFRANHKGVTHIGRVENGALTINGKRFDTPIICSILDYQNIRQRLDILGVPTPRQVNMAADYHVAQEERFLVLRTWI